MHDLEAARIKHAINEDTMEAVHNVIYGLAECSTRNYGKGVQLLLSSIELMFLVAVEKIYLKYF